MANQRKVAGGTTRLTQLIRIAIIAASAPMLWSEAALAEFNMSFIHGDENLSNAEAVAQVAMLCNRAFTHSTSTST